MYMCLVTQSAIYIEKDFSKFRNDIDIQVTVRRISVLEKFSLKRVPSSGM